MTEERTGLLIILRSEDDGETWFPVEPALVPDWLKEPDVMGRMVAGDMVQQKSTILSATVLPWYRAEKMDSQGETKQ